MEFYIILAGSCDIYTKVNMLDAEDRRVMEAFRKEKTTEIGIKPGRIRSEYEGVLKSKEPVKTSIRQKPDGSIAVFFDSNAVC